MSTTGQVPAASVLDASTPTWSDTAYALGPTDGFRTRWSYAVAGAHGTIVVGGYDFQTVIGAAPASIDSITVDLNHYIIGGGRIVSASIQLTDGTTPIGAPQAVTLRANPTTDTFTFPGVTWSQLANLGVAVTFNRGGTTLSASAYVDSVVAEVTYTAAPAAPADPTDLTATPVSPYAIDLAWTDNATTETGYTVQRCTGATCTDFTTVATLPANTTAWSDTGLAPDTLYRYQVRADGSGASSGWAGPASATTGTVPPDPGGGVDPSIPDERPTTGAFSPQVAEVITAGVVEITGRLRFPPGAASGPVDLAIIDGTLSWSERRSPRFQASLDCAIPEDVNVIDLTDSRSLVRVDVSIGYRLPDGSLDEQIVASPHLRERRVLRPSEIMRLELAGDEALVIDNATNPGAVDTTTWDLPATDVPAAARSIIRGRLAGGPASGPRVVYGMEPAGTGEAAPWPPDDYFDALDDLLDQVDAELVCDDGQTFIVRRRRNRTSAASAFYFRTGAGGVLLESDSAVSRDDWANRVTLRYEWTDNAGNAHTVYGSADVTGGPFVAAMSGVRTYTQRRTTPTTPGGAAKAAQTLLRRMLSRSRSYTLTAPSAYWLRPGDTVTVDLDAADTTRHLVAEVTHTLRDGRMRVTTRLPDTANTIGE